MRIVDAVEDDLARPLVHEADIRPEEEIGEDMGRRARQQTIRVLRPDGDHLECVREK